MIKNIIYLLILILLISCKQKEPDDYFKSLDFNLNTTSRDLKVKPPPPTISSMTIVLPINDNGEKYEIVTDNINGKIIYEENYKNESASYPKFLEKLSEGNYYINANLLDKFYYSDVNTSDSIFVEYRDKGFSYILNKYTLKKSSEHWEYYFSSNSATLPFESENSLVSIMYKHKYFIVYGDYAANYGFYKNRK